MKAREVIAKLNKDGWYVRNQRGSHVHFMHPTKPGMVTVSQHPGDIAKGTLRAIYKQAGWPWPP